MGSLLWSQFQDFAFGTALIFWASVLIGLAFKLWNEPRQTARKLFGSVAWFFVLLAILWVATMSDRP